MFILERFRYGDHLAHGHPTETVHRREDEPNCAHLLNHKKVLKHVANMWRCFRAHGDIDGHHCTSGGEIRKRERQNEKPIAIFAKLRIFNDYINDNNV